MFKLRFHGVAWPGGRRSGGRLIEEIHVSRREVSRRCVIFAIGRVSLAVLLVTSFMTLPSLWRCAGLKGSDPADWVGFMLWSYLGVTLVFLAATFLTSRKKQLTTFGLSMDLAAATLIVGSTGGAESQFVILYMIAIAGSAVMLSTVVGLGVSVASVALLGLVHLGDTLRWWELCAGRPAEQGSFFGFVAVLSFLVLTAFLSGYLSLRGSRLMLLNVELLESFNAGTVIIDLDGSVQYLNRIGGGLLGVEPQHVRGSPVERVFVVPGINILRESLEAAQPISRQEILFTMPDGDQLPLGISTSILNDHRGRMWGVLATFVNLSEAKRLEERARHADRMSVIAQLAAGMAHEIRNPLSCITGAVELLKDMIFDNEELEEVTGFMVRETQRLSAIVENFLDLSRLDVPRCTMFPFENLWEEVGSVIRARYGELLGSKIALHAQWRPHDLLLSADLGQVRQVLVNLVLNALEAFPQQGRIDVEARYASRDAVEGVEIMIEDDGPGIPHELRERVFDPFYSTKARGTGMGLAVVKRIVEGHGGDVKLGETEYGTTFRIWIPLQACTTG